MFGNGHEQLRPKRRPGGTLATETHKEAKNKHGSLQGKGKDETVEKRNRTLSEEGNEDDQSEGYRKVIANRKSEGYNKEAAHKTSREECKMMVIMRQIEQMERKEKAAKGCPCPNQVEGKVGHGSEDHDSRETTETEEFIADSIARLQAADKTRAAAGAVAPETPPTLRTNRGSI